MRINRIELKKITYSFNSNTNRLLQADYNDYPDTVRKYVNYIKQTPVIYEYICSCGDSEQDMAKEFSEVCSSYGHCIFALGDTPEEEVRNIFAILEYIADKNISIRSGFAMGYVASKQYQDMMKAFNNRVVMVFIRHLENYLTQLGIDMGLDDAIVYSISINNGQVNIANDNSNITVNNNSQIDLELLRDLLREIRNSAICLDGDNLEYVNTGLEVIEQEFCSEKPKRNAIKLAMNTLKTIKGTSEFAAAVATLAQFIQTIM